MYTCTINANTVCLESDKRSHTFECNTVMEAQHLVATAVERCRKKGHSVKVVLGPCQPQAKDEKPSDHASDAQSYGTKQHFYKADFSKVEENFFKKYYQNNPFGDFYKQQ